MLAAPLPDQEFVRLLDLAQYDVLGTGPEAPFDRLTRLAARVLQVPFALINLVDQEQLWSKSCFGISDLPTPREQSVCTWTILEDRVLTVPDLAQDPRFCTRAYVTGPPQLRMYAGAPLITPRGLRIGTLCVMDTAPRHLGAGDLATLQDLAVLVVDELELRRHSRDLEAQVDLQRRELDELGQLVAHAQVLGAVGELLETSLTPQEATLAAAGLIGEAIHADWTGLISLRGDALTIQVAHHQPDLSPALLDFAGRLPQLPGGVTHSLRGRPSATYLDDYASHPGALPEAVAAGLRAAAWLPLGESGETSFILVAVRAGRGQGQGQGRAAWRRSDRSLLDAAGRSVRAALESRTVLEARDRAARQDPLTGVGNRLALSEALGARKGEGTPFGLALIDLDGFKGINDSEGHAQGDQVLRVFAAALQGEARPGGEVYRYGGDEFVLLTAELDGDTVLEHVDLAVLAARQLTTQPLGASVGLVRDSAGEDGAALLALADERMYAVKRRRRGRRGAGVSRSPRSRP